MMQPFQITEQGAGNGTAYHQITDRHGDDIAHGNKQAVQLVHQANAMLVLLAAAETALPWLIKAENDDAFKGCALPLGGRKAIEKLQAAIAGARCPDQVEPVAKITKVCSECDSENVWKDATAIWCVDTQQWVLSGVQDHEGCNDCGTSGNGICESKGVTP